jgi:sugar-specific transcriptional regulator TrmB
MTKYNVSLTEKLIKTGLSEKEAKIYSVLVELGGAYPSRIRRRTLTEPLYIKY